ncbi:ABC transporter substrate-binding protein [Pontivivens insulae]|uniref:Spermidine/putrescine-binding periplasmic protein n=1 Tax=Pontivivens insulae TaxID=1639689 RepID=A0A2R8A7A7_9RHOB|nr:ABC transporter substrate-binding protein [Pontivivens insulae]RED18007.1 iron(III) transport system substrate-binding protein [Pontivivens insulae]SPF27900.1 Spermidine/putrescine-binding periplasmic protein [Pontivivens insulae]
MKRTGLLTGTALAAFCTLASTAQADELNVVCSAEQDWCDLMVSIFEAEHPETEVLMVRKSTGETLAQIRAEAGNPKIDVWWGGTGDPHLIAAEEGLLQASGVSTDELLGWAQNMSEISGGRTVGIYAGALGIAYNSEILEERDIAPPACWADLMDPRFAGEIQVANPNSSGTAYTELATFVQLFGEDEAFRMLRDIGENVNSYTSSGSAPSRAAARGETGVSIGFMHDMVKLAASGFPLEIVAPCEGTGYEVGAVSIIEGARNPEGARDWVEFSLRADIQSRAPEVQSYQVPSNSNAEVAPESPDLASIRLIDYDFATYGSSETRARLLARWDEEVGDPNPEQ